MIDTRTALLKGAEYIELHPNEFNQSHPKYCTVGSLFKANNLTHVAGSGRAAQLAEENFGLPISLTKALYLGKLDNETAPKAAAALRKIADEQYPAPTTVTEPTASTKKSLVTVMKPVQEEQVTAVVVELPVMDAQILRALLGAIPQDKAREISRTSVTWKPELNARLSGAFTGTWKALNQALNEVN